MEMERLIIKFSGENSHEPLLLGDHITVRPSRYYNAAYIAEGDTVILTDGITKSAGVVMKIVYDIPTSHLLKFGSLEGERSNLVDTRDLVDFLIQIYPDISSWTVIGYTVYLQGLL